MKLRPATVPTLLLCTLLTAGCSRSEPTPTADNDAATAAPALEWNDTVEGELPTRRIPNIPFAAEAYYAPDSLHVIAQTEDPLAGRNARGGYNSLTYTFTDLGTELRRINDKGQDACSYFHPDGKRLIWTSTRDHLDLPPGDWSNDKDYPRGAELYFSDLEGGNVQRITDNTYYDAEVTVSPDGSTILFGRQIDGKMDLWVADADGSNQRQITFTDEWQEGGAFFLPDSDRILFRAWKRDEFGAVTPTPMTLFTIRKDGTDLRRHSVGNGMHWAPYPAPDGRHYVYVSVIEGRNWAVMLGDFAGGEPRRLTFAEGFNGFPSLSPDGTKLLFARAYTNEEGRDGLTTFVQDVSSLGIGPDRVQPFDDSWGAKVQGNPDRLDRNQPIPAAAGTGS
ncbi:MAG: hypothetical protein R3E75_02330 [Steroidobacteraceae bacterium]|nr:PD40 domain-containing protein [Nevskiaceae bacterium]MCP5338975.1 PD40 domain-containing protein [Nevskiaceae bacterium]MCP5359613.1 PD40 domain-containing protein [Nevskiaceae bacterium]MCP5472594.1 PD40 domain-containing protein [Nevskiaceae bacterium]